MLILAFSLFLFSKIKFARAVLGAKWLEKNHGVNIFWPKCNHFLAHLTFWEVITQYIAKKWFNSFFKISTKKYLTKVSTFFKTGSFWIFFYFAHPVSYVKTKKLKAKKVLLYLLQFYAHAQLKFWVFSNIPLLLQ